MIYSPVQLANYLKLMRQKNQWTQNDLARRIGIKQATISNFENHPDKTSLTTLFKILQSLEMSMVIKAKNGDNNTEHDDNTEDLNW
ncbi:type II toxin-antitoxin system antitoxin HipB [Klebsiella sp. R445]